MRLEAVRKARNTQLSSLFFVSTPYVPTTLSAFLPRVLVMPSISRSQRDRGEKRSVGLEGREVLGSGGWGSGWEEGEGEGWKVVGGKGGKGEGGKGGKGVEGIGKREAGKIWVF